MLINMRAAILCICLVKNVHGHGAMTWPPTRIGTSMETAGWCVGANPFTERGTCFWWSQCCTPGCGNCTGSARVPAPTKPDPHAEITRCCDTPMEPTLDPKYRTEPDVPEWGGDITKYSPWRSPGHGPVLGPCGVAGGWPNWKNNPVAEPASLGPWQEGVQRGMDGRDVPKLTQTRTVWEAGSIQEVAWSVYANHGGGYAYRLCPADNLTEEGCAAGHLQFVGERTFIQYRSDKKNRTAIPATRVTDGTYPKGSMWTTNPIPGCNGHHSGGRSLPHEDVHNCDKGPVFEPPLPGLFGHGASTCFNWNGETHMRTANCTIEEEQHWYAKFNFNIIDLVQIPLNAPAGDYVLSWRWDAEETHQIWTGCSDVAIVKPGTTLV